MDEHDLYETLVECYRGHLSELSASLDRCWDLMQELQVLGRLTVDLSPQLVSEPEP